MMYLKQRIEEVVPGVVSGYRCNGTVDWQLEKHPYYPPTVNDAGAAAFVQQVAAGVLGAENVSAGTGSWSDGLCYRDQT